MNSNPFEPVAVEPAELQPTDNEPDNFAADNNDFGDNFSSKPTRPSVMLDGISPNTSSLDFDSSNVASVAAPSTGVAIDGILNQNTQKNPLSEDMSRDILEDTVDANEFLNSKEDAELIAPAALSDKELKANKKAAEKAEKQLSKDSRPTRQFTISIASIILSILTIAGIAGCVYFYMQNNDNANKLKDSQAQVEELKTNGVNASTSENMTTTQFDALQDKIANLTKQADEKQKTIDENKKSIDALTVKNSELTKTNADLTSKVQNISDMTTRLDTMLKKLDTLLVQPTNGG